MEGARNEAVARPIVQRESGRDLQQGCASLRVLAAAGEKAPSLGETVGQPDTYSPAIDLILYFSTLAPCMLGDVKNSQTDSGRTRQRRRLRRTPPDEESAWP